MLGIKYQNSRRRPIIPGEEKLDKILEILERLEKHHKIVPDREITITDFESSLQAYEEFAIEELDLEQITINNHKSTILGFLNHSKGIITKETVKAYLDSKESPSWKSNQVKALRKYTRDHLKLGRWIEEFKFSKVNIKPKITTLPTNEQLAQFCISLPSFEMQLIFLIMLNSGLRISEVLGLNNMHVDLTTNMIDASNIHTGKTKFSWISFVTKNTSDLLQEYIIDGKFDLENGDFLLFDISARSIQQAFTKVSKNMKLPLHPHSLRTIFSEKCREAKIDKEYIEAFCGRTPQGVLSQNYTNYSPESLRKQYDKVEPYLELSFEGI